MLARRLCVVIVLLLPFGLAHAGEGLSAANEIEKFLKTEDPRAFGPALSVWEMSGESILEELSACLKTARAFSKYGGCAKILRYRDIPGECVDIVVECLEMAEEMIAEDDFSKRLAIGRCLKCTAEIHLARGHGDKAEKLLDRSLVHLEAVVAVENPPLAGYLELGSLYGKFASRDPKTADDYIAKAAVLFDAAREKCGDSASLSLKVGQTFRQLAEMREEQLAKTPKDRKLAKSVKASWGEAMDAFAEGREQEQDNAELNTAYNDCLWEFMRVNKGRCKLKPVMKVYQSSDRKIGIGVPDSASWHVVPKSELKDYVFKAYKYNRKAGQAFRILISEYRWDTNYRNTETDEVVGGDNIGGLARMSEKDVKAYFKDIKKRYPLRKMPISRRIPKAEAFVVKGMTDGGDATEWRGYYFKHSKARKTYEVTIIADLGMLERNPYELKAVLSSFELLKRRR